MPMFDDPRKELRRLEEELLAAEYEQEEQIEQYDEFEDFGEYDEDEAILAEARALIGEEEPPIYRNHANGYGTRMPNPAVDFNRTVYADEEFDEDSAVLVEKKKKEKGIGGLVFLAILELIGILGIVGWWVLWLL